MHGKNQKQLYAFHVGINEENIIMKTKIQQETLIKNSNLESEFNKKMIELNLLYRADFQIIDGYGYCFLKEVDE